MIFNDQIKEVKDLLEVKYSEITNFFFVFLIENEITITDLRSLRYDIEIFKDFNVTKKNESLLLEKDGVTIEISFVFKNTYKKLKKTKTEYDLEKLNEGDVLDIVFIKDGQYYLFLSENKEIIIQSEKINAVYSPMKKDWHASVKFNDDFYNNMIIIEFPYPQIHYIRKNVDGSFYKSISIDDLNFFPIEYHKDNKLQDFTLISKDYYCEKKILKPLFNKNKTKVSQKNKK